MPKSSVILLFFISIFCFSKIKNIAAKIRFCSDILVCLPLFFRCPVSLFHL